MLAMLHSRCRHSRGCFQSRAHASQREEHVIQPLIACSDNPLRREETLIGVDVLLSVGFPTILSSEEIIFLIHQLRLIGGKR